MKSEGELDNQDTTSHEFNFFIDRQLQNKLLQADDVFEQETDGMGCHVKSGPVKPAKIDPSIDITGWFPDTKFVARKVNDGATKDTKPAKESNFIHPWRDYKFRNEVFVFKHYKDNRRYIEQYRNDHGCAGGRHSSAHPLGDTRRIAFHPQNSAPPQPPAQVQLQNVWNGKLATATANTQNHTTLQYTNKKDQIGTLINPNCNGSCNKPNYVHRTDPSSQEYRYKLVQSPYMRTNTDIRSHYADSDNSSESGEMQSCTLVKRVGSATSVRSMTSVRSKTSGKVPTKISVPANNTVSKSGYPLQALTLQNGGVKHVERVAETSCKPLDHLNIVAPEKQAIVVEKREVEPIGLSLDVQGFGDLLGKNEAPLRGYALPRSTIPRTRRRKLFQSHPDLEGLTWTEKLECLRSVNKRPERQKQKPQKLRYIRDSPLELLPLDSDQLYEQRRIKHLVEQARLKGGKQYNWVYEAKVRAVGVDWDTSKVNRSVPITSGEIDGVRSWEPGSRLSKGGNQNESRRSKGDNCSSRSSSGSGSRELETSSEDKFGKYGIYVPRTNPLQTLFNSHGIERSNTFIIPS